MYRIAFHVKSHYSIAGHHVSDGGDMKFNWIHWVGCPGQTERGGPPVCEMGSGVTTLLFKDQHLTKREAGLLYGFLFGVLGFDSWRGLGIFLFTTASRTALGPTEPPYRMGTWGSFPGVKAIGAQSWPLTSI